MAAGKEWLQRKRMAVEERMAAGKKRWLRRKKMTTEKDGCGEKNGYRER